MEHAELKVPKIVLGIAVSRTDDNDDIRRRRGLQDFSILARDSSGEEILRISANDQITKYNTMMAADRPPRQFLRRPSTSGVGWPMILVIVIAVVGAVSFGITIYCFKTRHGLSWTFCQEAEDDIEKEAVISNLMHVTSRGWVVFSSHKYIGDFPTTSAVKQLLYLRTYKVFS